MKKSPKPKALKPLNAKELQSFEELLLKLKRKIFREKRYIDSIVLNPKETTGGELSSYRTHVADVGSETYQREVSSQISTYEAQLLRAIDDALRRLREGRYGICLKCGRQIPRARLKALPYAELCITCSQKSKR
jgi:RNA polymerase-binding protein DksA